MGIHEDNLRQVVDAEAFDIPALFELRNSMLSLIDVVPTALQPQGWTGPAAEAAGAAADEIVRRFGAINDVLHTVETTIAAANAATARAAAAISDLPGVNVDPKIVAAAKEATHVTFLGVEYEAEGAVSIIANILGGQREEKAKLAEEQLEKDLSAQADVLVDARASMGQIKGFELKDVEPTPPPTADTPAPAPSPRAPSAPVYPTPTSTGGLFGTGIETGTILPPVLRPPIVITDPPRVIVDPVVPTIPTVPVGPSPDGSLDTGTVPGTGPGSSGLVGSGPHGGGLTGGLGSGAGLGGGLIGGGASAAALAAAKLGGGAGGIGGAGGRGLGSEAGSTGRSAAGGRLSGGGLLGGAQSGTGSSAAGARGLGSAMGSAGGAGGSGGAAGGRSGMLGGSQGSGSSGASGSSSAVTSAHGGAAGGRGGSGMMGGGDDDEREKRSGLGGPLAPKLDDEADKAPRSAGASAGGRTPRVEK